MFCTKDTWPRTSALYCHPVPSGEWPDQPEIVERIPLKTCVRRGAAIDVVADRGREHRSQIVFTRGRGREMVFWQSPRTRKQARPDVRLPTARAAGVLELEIVVDAHERYPYKFAGQQVATVRRGLACGDNAVTLDKKIVAAVERKSLADLVSSLISGRLRFALGELATLPRAAVVVEDRYSQGLHPRPGPSRDRRRRPGRAAGPLPGHPDRVLRDPQARRGMDLPLPRRRTHLGRNRGGRAGPDRPPRRDARRTGPRPEHHHGAAHGRDPSLGPRERITVPDRGRLRPEIHQAWRDAHPR